MGGPRPDLEYHDAGAANRRETHHLAKVAIQCDERSAFARAHFEQSLVRRPSQLLSRGRDRVMAGSTKQLGRTPAEILVKLEFHAAFSVGRR